ncbi:carbamoyl-phosphate synthase small chain [Clostridia bacterium]|nr:carbamoyl-phosphate synthase small chain [Clostridia bacterium]
MADDMGGCLMLADGKVFSGVRCGAYAGADFADAYGELVFTTQMTGFLETLTDPSYYGQIVIQTFPLVGNYGVIREDFEHSSISLSGYIAREFCAEPSNFRSGGTIDGLLTEQGIPALSGVNTRELTRIIRNYGALPAVFLSKNPEELRDGELDEIKEKLRDYKVKDAVRNVTSKEIIYHNAKNPKYKIAFWDFGAKRGIIRALNNAGADVISFPAYTTASEILSHNPDGLMLSNGPGDPKDLPEISAEIGKFAQSKIPIFGICLGHQLLAISQGAKTEKLKYGHRGGNHPVLDIRTQRLYITSQNHGYAVSGGTLSPSVASVTMINDHDKTCEGIEYKKIPAFSAQFHPEACSGPEDTAFLFREFIENIERQGGANRAS